MKTSRLPETAYDLKAAYPSLPSEVKRAYERLAWALENFPRILARLGLAKAG